MVIETAPTGGWSSIPKWVKIRGAIAIPIILVFVLLFGMLGWYNHVRNGLIDRETVLNAQYQANQAELDAFVKKVNEEFQIAGAKTEALDKVLTDAIRGRYDKDLGTVTPGAPGSALISAMVEAYPDLKGLDVFDRIITEISAGRENFKQVQVKLLDMIRDYKSYRSKGVIHSMMVNSVGYPQLQARIGGTDNCPPEFIVENTCVRTGKAALNQMQLIVTSGATNQDFTSGTEAPLLPTTTAGK